MRYIPLLLLPLLILPLVGGGCYKSASESYVERSIESQSGGAVDVEIDDDLVTYTDETTGGSMQFGEDIDLPSNFPEDLPVYSGKISINSTMVIPDQGVTLMFTTDDSIDDVLDWYADELLGDGWTQQMTYNLEDQKMSSYTKDGVTMNLSAGVEDDATVVTIIRTETY